MILIITIITNHKIHYRQRTVPHWKYANLNKCALRTVLNLAKVSYWRMFYVWAMMK